MRRQLRKAENRLATDGMRVDIQFSRTEPEIRLLLPQLDRIHIERDHAAGRASDLDEPNVRELWRQLILNHTVGDQIEVATLSLNDALVACRRDMRWPDLIAVRRHFNEPRSRPADRARRAAATITDDRCDSVD
jgi:hypothetical protein